MTAAPAEEKIEVDLQSPWVAGLLAWLIPGAGHFYQKRYGKAVLFSTCVLGSFLYGVFLCEGKAIYAAEPLAIQRVQGRWYNWVSRYPYAAQFCAGLPALPAMLQRVRVNSGKPPILGGFMAPPRDQEELAAWQLRLNIRYDMGLLYTMVAGLLNVLVIYDAIRGPMACEMTDETPPPGAKKK